MSGPEARAASPAERNQRGDRLRRSVLFVPGGHPRRLEKAPETGADSLVLDLEDSVAPEEKDRARQLVADTLRARALGEAEAIVRVNAPGTPHFAADLEAAVAAGADAVMLPKSQRADTLAEVSARLDRLERRLERAPDAALRLLALVETPAGVARVAWLADASERIDALCFGHADFAREMGLADADASAGVLLHARCAVAIAAKAAGVSPIDCVFLDVRDEQAFAADVALGLRLGFEGKLCIHPTQVRIANDVYTPAPERVAHAQRVVEGFERALAGGSGVFSLDGKMVDAPLVAIEKRILERARRAGVLPGGGGC
ncbi:MAG: CoA ester lyase [Myxococcales bacterium]|nr:CoA ester lyase [Myxococcales bacterium]MDH5565132.1 CoA ester lyase [Myxococcales bacterium]